MKRALPVLSCPVQVYRLLVGGAEVRQVPGDLPRLHPTGQPLDPILFAAFTASSGSTSSGGLSFPGCLAPLRRPSTDGARSWGWAHEVNETIH